jgi:hypothetical protein
MNRSRTVAAIFAIAFVIAIGAMAGHTANAAIVPTVGLGTAANFSVLAGTPNITNTGPTTIDRDVGIHPGSAVTGFPPGIVGGQIHAADSVALQAKSDLVTAYLDAAGRPFTSTQGALDGLILVGGVYRLQSLAADLTGTVTLDGAGDPNSVWIFQSPSTLITGSTSSVNLINGASPCNVFWQVGSSATLGTNSTFRGTILALTMIAVTTGAIVDGRALARNGAVTLDTNRIITSTCNVPPPTVVSTCPPGPGPFIGCIATPFPSPTATPGATVAATATPASATATPTAATPTAAPTTVAVAAPTATPAVAGVQRLPATSTVDLGPLTMLGVALAGIGILLLRGRPVRHL